VQQELCRLAVIGQKNWIERVRPLLNRMAGVSFRGEKADGDDHGIRTHRAAAR
jgi:hypothetical protein